MDATLIAEFRGLFWGEGCADLQKYTRKTYRYPIYRPRLRISLNYRDAEMLKVIQQNFGGYLSDHREYKYATHVTHKFVTWTSPSGKGIIQLCDYLLEGHTLPSVKVQQVELIRSASMNGIQRGKKQGVEGRSRLEELYLKLQSLKQTD